MARLSFYIVDSAYCDFLRKTDPCVPYTMDKKARRPFVGILLEVHGVKYYAPLSSPKPKHLTMKNQVDFIKIDGGQYGVINLNNMIPIHNNSVTVVNPTIQAGDSSADIIYKNLLANQLTWCNAHKTDILDKALKLYRMITSGKGYPQLISRCCNFTLDEQKLGEYSKLKGWN